MIHSKTLAEIFADEVKIHHEILPQLERLCRAVLVHLPVQHMNMIRQNRHRVVTSQVIRKRPENICEPVVCFAWRALKVVKAEILTLGTE